MRDRKKDIAFRVIVLIIVLLPIALLASYFIQPDLPKVDLVDDGGFEQGKGKWLLGDQPAKNVSIVDELSHNGTHSLRIIGGGQGFNQDWALRAVTPGTHLVFFTLLESVDRQDLPQALFHLYFYLYNNPIRYHIDITVTHENGDPYRESAFDPDPGTLPGGVSVWFNRNGLGNWTMISLDVSDIIRKHFPNNFWPSISGVLLENSGDGVVYYDDVSVTTSSIVNPLVQLGSFVYYNTIGQVVFGTLVSLGLSEFFKAVYHRAKLRPKSKNSPTNR
jgi:hypothetical protein